MMKNCLLSGVVALGAAVLTAGCTPFEYGEHSIYPSARARPHSTGRIDESAVLLLTDDIARKEKKFDYGGGISIVPMPDGEADEVE